MSLKRWLQAGALLIGVLTLAAMGSQLLGARGLLLANGQPVFGDYLAFWSAGRLALEGRANEVYSAAAIVEAHHAAAAGLDVIFPYRHPPAFLLFAAPLAGLPFIASALAFIALSGALFLFAARLFVRRGGDLLFAATSPAVLLQIGSVQMGVLLTGLMGLGLRWLSARPLLAGVCIGLMAIKPHLAVLWPFMLIVQHNWRTLWAAAATAILLSLLAGMLFGFELYGAFFEAVLAGQESLRGSLILKGTTASLYANLTAIGAPGPLALGVHAASAGAAFVLALMIWRRGDAAASAAALASATLLISPYLFFYDATLLLIGVGALSADARKGEIGWLCFAWAAAGLSLAVGLFFVLPICPLASWAILLIAARRAGVTLPGNRAARPA